MKFVRELSLKNLTRRPGRSLALGALSALLSFSILTGSLVVSSLRRGLQSYEARLGADVVVVPKQASLHGSLEDILLGGIPGYYYMDEAACEKIASRPGIAALSPQFYLASESAGCCSAAVQIIGFDPETDFVIQPWIQTSWGGSVGDGELLVGSGIEVPASRTLRFYNHDFPVRAQLEETGTGLDTAVYANLKTIREMMKDAGEAGFRRYEGDPERAVSSLLLRVEEGYSIQQVVDDINVHVRKVEAGRAKTMVSSLASGLGHISTLVGLLVVLVWLLSLGILALAFWMLANERRREFAVLRLAGASEGTLRKLLLTESLLLCLGGALCGALLSALAVLPFSALLRQGLGLPYLLPGPLGLLGLLLGAVGLSALAGALTARLTARGLTGEESGLLLREDA